MSKSSCIEFEKAVYADSEVGLELQRHAEHCERCGSLQEVVALSALPVAAERTDPFAATVIAAAKEMSRKRGTDWERRRRVAPLLIGTTGYLLTICWVVSSMANRGLERAVPASSAVISLPPLPAPSPLSVMAVLLASAAAMVLVALATRGRRVLSPSPSGNSARAPR